MLSTPRVSRKPSLRDPFRTPLWDDQHPDFLRLDATLPKDHHARWLRAVVARLDLTPLQQTYTNRGSQAYPPALLLAFVLFMYAKGLVAPADWHQHVLYDDQAKWLLRGLQPTRARLYAFRERVAPFLDHWHQQLIDWAVCEGLTTARHGSLDGTFVASLASRHQLLSSRRLDQRLLWLRLLVWCDGAASTADLPTRLAAVPPWLLTAVLVLEEMLRRRLDVGTWTQTVLHLVTLLALLFPEGTPQEQPQVPSWLPQSVAGRRRVLRRYENAQQRLTHKQQPLLRKAKLSKKDQATLKHLKVSVSDPEAALGYDKQDTYRPLYNVALVQATDAPLTLAFEVLARNNDDGLLKPMMEKTQAQLGHHLDDVRVDGAFKTVGEVAWCEQQNIVVYAPAAKRPAAQTLSAPSATGVPTACLPEPPASRVAVPSANPASAVPAAAAGAGQPAKQLPKSAFRYAPQEQCYYCPQGKRLEVKSRTKVKRQYGLEVRVLIHQASGEDCQACPLQPRCTRNAKQGRVVKRYEGEEALERLEQRMQEPASQQAYRQRKQSVELGYADVKTHRGLRVFRCFGQARARAQAGLTILAANGLKIQAALQRRLAAEPNHSPEAKQVA